MPAANNVKESLPSLPNEPHPPNIFDWKTQLMPAVIPMGRKVGIHVVADVCGLTSFGLKLVSEAI